MGADRLRELGLLPGLVLLFPFMLLPRLAPLVAFLAGLTLFVMTFILNTLAEIVRIRFRRRAVQL